MNTQFNSALKQSTAIRRDLSSLTSSGAGQGAAAPLTPAALGALSASLTALARTIDEYESLARQELVIDKKTKAEDRIRNFRAELAEYREQFGALRARRDDAQHAQNRAELLGRRPFATHTPENPYAHGGGGNNKSSDEVPTNRYGSGGAVGGQMSMGTGDYTRETHALREQTFFDQTNSALDEYIARGQAVLGDLGTQREMLKNTQKRLYSVANTLGVSGDTIRMIERRAKQDKWIFAGGALAFFAFVWLCLHFLR